MKRLITGWIAVLICGLFSLGAFAQAPEEHPARLVDTANLLSATEETILLEQLDEISLRQAADVVIVTVDHLKDYTPEEFAKNYYKEHRYGLGLRKSGVILLVSEKSVIYTKGFGAKAVNRNGVDYLMEQLAPVLESGEYAKAFSLFATETDQLLEMARQGHPYKPAFNDWLYLLIALAAVVVVFWGVVFVFRLRRKK